MDNAVQLFATEDHARCAMSLWSMRGPHTEVYQETKGGSWRVAYMRGDPEFCEHLSQHDAFNFALQLYASEQALEAFLGRPLVRYRLIVRGPHSRRCSFHEAGFDLETARKHEAMMNRKCERTEPRPIVRVQERRGGEWRLVL